MKRSILVLLIFFFAAGLTFTQSITVTSPGSGDNWEKGRRYNITWAKTGRMDANVKIRLFNDTGTTKILDIVNNTLNDGSFPWDIPGSVDNGNYLIRVKTTDNRFSDDGDVFSIVSGGIMDILPSLPDTAELSIEEVTRTDTNRVRIGAVLDFRVKVKNIGRNSANICVANTNSDKDRNFYDRGECGVINGNSTKFYSISIRVTRLFKATVFLIKSGVEDLLGTVIWKDSNMRNDTKNVYFPESLPDLIVTEITEVRYGHSIVQPELTWTLVKVKIKNQGSIPSTSCKISLGSFSTSPRHTPLRGLMIFDMPGIPAGGTITGILPDSRSELGNPRNEFDISIIVNRIGSPRVTESNYTNNELRMNISRLNVIEDNTVPSRTERRTATWIE